MRTKNIALIALTIMLSIHIQRIEACTRAVYIGPDNLIVILVIGFALSAYVNCLLLKKALIPHLSQEVSQ